MIIRLAFISLISTSPVLAQAIGTQYEIEVLGDDSRWANGSTSFDINDAGTIIGRGRDGDCGVAWRWTPAGGFETSDTCTWAEGINSVGTTAGAVGRPGHAAILPSTSGDFNRLPVPPGVWLSNGHDINDSGIVIANGRTSGGGTDYGFAWIPGSSGYTQAVQLLPSSVMPWKINNQGVIIGWTTSSPNTGVVWEPSSPGNYSNPATVLPDLPTGSGYRAPRAITDGGQIAGFAFDAGVQRAVSWDSNGIQRLDDSGFSASTVLGAGTTEVLVGAVKHPDDELWWAALWKEGQLIALRDRIIGRDEWPGGISAIASNADGWIAAHGTNEDGRVLPMVLRPLSPAACDGDANGDNTVDVNDISYVLFRLGTNPDACGEGDANGDGIVDVNDIVYILFRLNTCNTGGSC